MHLMLAISFPWLYYFYCWLFREPVILFNYSLLCRFMQVSSLISSICQWCTLVYQCNGKPPSSYLSRRFSNLQLLSITDQSPLGKGLISDQSPSRRSFHVCSSALFFQTFIYPTFNTPPLNHQLSVHFVFRPTGSTTAVLQQSTFLRTLCIPFLTTFDTVLHSALALNSPV